MAFLASESLEPEDDWAPGAGRLSPAHGRRQSKSCGRLRTVQSGTTLRYTPTPDAWHRFWLRQPVSPTCARASATMATKARSQGGRARAAWGEKRTSRSVVGRTRHAPAKRATHGHAIVLQSRQGGVLRRVRSEPPAHSLWPDERRKEANGYATITPASRGLYPAGVA